MERLRVPHRDLPNFPLRVRVCTRRCRRCSKSLLDVAQRRRRRRRAVDTHALRRRCIGRKIDGLLEKAVVSLAEESVEGVDTAHDRQGMHEEGRLSNCHQPSSHCRRETCVLCILTSHANHPLPLFPSMSPNTSSLPLESPGLLEPLARMNRKLSAIPIGVAQLFKRSSCASSLSSSESHSRKSPGSRYA